MSAPAAIPALGSFYARYGKRAFDLCIALAVLVLLGPLMLLVALLIKLEDGGPVFYRQERIGRGGKPYRVTKFRSMELGAEHRGAGILVQKNDARITRTGKILRKLSLDELAQIFDVLRGDMSCVGPRPGLRYQYELYDDEQRERLLVRPGITGWAQVHGRNAITWPERIRRDREYIRRLSWWTDILVILKTLPAIVTASGQIADADYWKNRRRELEAAQPPTATAQLEPEGERR